MAKSKTLLEQIVQDAVENALVLEGIKPNVNLNINGKNVSFGSKEHIMDLKRLLVSLENLKNCYGRGTANRHVYSAACSKVRKLVNKLIADLMKKSTSKITPVSSLKTSDKI